MVIHCVKMEESSDEKTDTATSSEHSSNFGFLTTQYELLYLILSCLPMQDLNSAACVCKSWYEACKVIKRERHSMNWLHWYICCQEKKKTGRTRKESRSGNGENEETESFKVVPVNKFVEDMLSDVYSEPNLCMLFASTTLLDNQEQFMFNNGFGGEDQYRLSPKQGSASRDYVINYIKCKLPKSCTVLGVGSPGVVGTSSDRQVTMEIENEESFSCLLFPQLPGVTMRHFVIDEIKHMSRLKSKEVLSSEDMTKLTGIPPTEDVKCLLLFCNAVEIGGEAARVIAKTLICSQNERIAVGGGFADTVVLPSHSDKLSPEQPFTVGIAISGPEVKAASTIIRHTVKKAAGVEKVIQELKNSNIPEENSLAFMFACVGRGKGFYRKQNVESQIFRKYFPNTPLFGFFGNGEIGIQYIPQFGNVEEVKHSFKTPKGGRKKREELFHGYTTILVLVSLGKTMKGK